eukprot:TRINITY_DN4248_c0_g1_i2.p1 TRINITY_DN4248_c0_g1~~TRINITY_DN4248_c0_g1_i2.p1  ORF type:complete len:386 (+),score=93.44 TRINITY_DN4248_c0_g1_i2:20-1177(+)
MVKQVWLYQHSGVSNIASLDPTCLSAHAFLRFINQPYTALSTDTVGNVASHAPVCTLPMIRIDEPMSESPDARIQEEFIPGFDSIVDHMRGHVHDLDAGLLPNEKAESRAFITMVTGELHDATLYHAWKVPANIDESRRNVGSFYSFPLSVIIPYLTGSHYTHGHLARYNDRAPEDMYEMARRCYDALSKRLGSRSFFYDGMRMGITGPRVLDAVVFGHLFLQATVPYKDMRLATLLGEFPNLVQFVQKIHSTYFPSSDPSFPGGIWPTSGLPVTNPPSRDSSFSSSSSSSSTSSSSANDTSSTSASSSSSPTYTPPTGPPTHPEDASWWARWFSSTTRNNPNDQARIEKMKIVRSRNSFLFVSAVAMGIHLAPLAIRFYRIGKV